MNHPAESRLALYAGGELGWIERLGVRSHLGRCAECSQTAQMFHQVRESSRAAAAQLPADLNWDRLAAEMAANIRLGVEAGECVGPVRETPRLRWNWKPAALAAGTSCLLAAAWWLNIPPPGHRLAQNDSRVVLQSTPAGIELKDSRGALTLMHTRSDSAVVYTSAPNSLRVRYVDAETGQITINNVYAQ